MQWSFLCSTLSLSFSLARREGKEFPILISLFFFHHTAHSSIHSRIVSTFHGLSTIHSTHSERVLMDEFHRDMDHNTSAMYLNLATTRAFALWLDIICSLYIGAVIVSLLFLKGLYSSSPLIRAANSLFHIRRYAERLRWHGNHSGTPSAILPPVGQVHTCE
jgi:hypothetical protein